MVWSRPSGKGLDGETLEYTGTVDVDRHPTCGPVPPFEGPTPYYSLGVYRGVTRSIAGMCGHSRSGVK